MPVPYRFKKQSWIDNAQQRTRNGTWALMDVEIFWRDHFQFLKKRGYLLRNRFHPGWTPSWLGTDLVPQFCDDGQILLPRYLIDAERIHDGKVVVVKATEIASSELQITKMLSPTSHSDPSNHCVPLLDDFPDNEDNSRHYIVMPLLRRFDDPPFYDVDEVISFVEQTLEGLAHIHEHGIAHRDCSVGNIMMDADELFPKGFHPTATSLTPDCHEFVKPLRRRDVGPIKYYFIDFGISTFFEDPARPRLVIGTHGQDQDVPELSKTVPYDPFLVDIFILGNVYRRTFLREYSNVDFLRPLVERMMQQVPHARPTAAQALELFRTIVRQQDSLGMRLRRRDETSKAAFWMDMAEKTEQILRVAKSMFVQPLFFVGVILTGTLVATARGPSTIFNRIRALFGRG